MVTSDVLPAIAPVVKRKNQLETDFESWLTQAQDIAYTQFTEGFISQEQFADCYSQLARLQPLGERLFNILV